MENLFYQISQVLGISIIHSLWQGLIIYLLLRLVFQFALRLPAQAKYGIAYAALCVLLCWFGYTLFTQIGNYKWQAVPEIPHYLPVKAIISTTFTQWTTPADRYYFIIADYLPYVSILYISGLLFNLLRMSMALNDIYHVRRHATATGFAGHIGSLSQKIGIRKYVQSGFSEYIDVPCITGFLKPIILLPFSISTNLTADELTAILLHELAHVRRNDYLLNLIQQVINVLLFFNPFGILINRVINREREHSCDDIVVRTTGSPLIYAQALLKLEESTHPEWQLALAATGKKHHLFNRIERIMKTKKTPVNIRPALIALMILACSLSSIAWLSPKAEHGKISIKAVTNPLNNILLRDTTKKAAVKASIKTALVKNTTLKKTDNIRYTQDTLLERLQAEITKHAQAIASYYSSPEFTQMQADIAKQQNETGRTELLLKKRLQEQIAQKEAELDKLNKDTRLELLKKQLDEASKKVKAYMTGPEFAKMTAKVRKINDKMDKEEDDRKTDKHMAEINKAMSDFTNNSKIKPTVDLAKKLDMEIKAYYNQPEYLKTKRELKTYSDSLKLYSERLERPEKPERPERPEKPERAEQPEQAERPERPEQAERPEYRNQQIVREKEAMERAEKELTDYKNRLDQQKKQ